MAARPAAGSSAAYGPPSDVHPVLRRAAAPPPALDLLAKAQHGLDEAATLQSANERFATAHLAALRAAAAVLAVRGRPEPTARRRKTIRSAWEVLPEVAPELAEWSALFASGADRRPPGPGRGRHGRRGKPARQAGATPTTSCGTPGCSSASSSGYSGSSRCCRRSGSSGPADGPHLRRRAGRARHPAEYGIGW